MADQLEIAALAHARALDRWSEEEGEVDCPSSQSSAAAAEEEEDSHAHMDRVPSAAAAPLTAEQLQLQQARASLRQHSMRRPAAVKLAAAAPSKELPADQQPALRAVWSKYLQSMMRQQPRATWHPKPAKGQSIEQCLEEYSGSDAARKSYAQLTLATTQLQHCCCSALALAMQPVDRALLSDQWWLSPLAVLDKRLAYLQSHAFDFGKLKTELIFEAFHTRSMRGVEWQRPWKVHGVDLCATCLAACIDRSPQSLHRWLIGWTARPGEQQLPLSGGLLALVADCMMRWARADGQTNPTDTQHTHHYVMNWSTEVGARLDLIRWMEQQGHTLQVTKGTWNRAKEHIKEHHSFALTCKKSKQLAVCATCSTYDNKIAAADKAKLSGRSNKLRTQKHEHLQEEREQRRWFTQLKESALRHPHLTWVLTLDGMDTAKTGVPHLQEPVKGFEYTAKVRVVGAFAFGAPLPCQAITSLEDVISKGGAASITCIDMLLDAQFRAMDIAHVAPLLAPHQLCDRSSAIELDRAEADELSARFAAARASARHQPAEAVPFDGVPMPAGAPAPGAAFPRATRVPFYWPRSAHFTFDNTAADCKNSVTFNYLGALVGLGVFHYVTMSTLLVGHTHDIVDQMFSVWSSKLKRSDCLTLNDLHALLRQYSSGIFELDKLHKLQRQSSGRAAASSSAGAPLADHREQPAVHPLLTSMTDPNRLHPVVMRQTLCIQPFDVLNSDIPGILKVHVFYVCREMDRDEATDRLRPAVMLYSRHLAEDNTNGRVVERSEWKDKPHGPYTACKRLFWIDDLRSGTAAHPVRQPARDGNAEQLEECIKALHQDLHKLSPAQRAEWDTLLAQLRRNAAADMDACERCRVLQGQLQAIGPLHRPDKRDSAAQRAAYNAQVQRRDGLKKELAQHIGTHQAEHLQVTDWLAKWVEREELFLRPYYAARGIVTVLDEPAAAGQADGSAPMEDDDIPLGRLPLPPLMPHDAHRGLLFKRISQFAVPTAGQFVTTRGQPWQPIFIGEVEDSAASLRDYVLAKLRGKRGAAHAPPAASPKRARRSSTPAGSRGRGRSARSKTINYQEAASESDAETDEDDQAASEDITSDSQWSGEEEGEEEQAAGAGACAAAAPAQRKRKPSAQAAADAAAFEARVERKVQRKLAKLGKDQFRVRYYVFVKPTKSKSLGLINNSGAIEAHLRKSNDAAALECWQQAVAAAQEDVGEFHPLPAAAVDCWKAVKWQRRKGNKKDEDVGTLRTGAINGVFERAEDIFTGDKKLTAKAFRRLLDDLTERGEHPDAEAAAAAAVAPDPPPPADRDAPE